MLILDDVTFSLGDRVLLDRASAQIPSNARVGLVGRNGVGKTTLFRLIAGVLPLDSGTIEMPRRARIGRLAQEAPEGPESLLDVVLAADVERTALLNAAERETDPLRVAEIQTRLADISAHSAPPRAAAILAGLGFSAADQQRPCSEFSGGWRMRVALASVLFTEPDLLLLDEPTNYLDLEGALWLEAHLARYPRTLIIVSHDRDLLDNAVDWTLHLHGGKLALYRGGYSSFERQRHERQILDVKHAKQQDLQRKKLQAFVDRFRAKATKARQAQSRLKLLAKLEPRAALTGDHVRPISIPDPARPLSPPIVAFDDVAAGYEPGRPVLRRLTLRIDDDDRIALLGANGNGKSTLAKLLAGRMQPMQGRITRADKLAVGYFAQHQLDELDITASAYDHIRRRLPEATETTVRTQAGTMGFSGALADSAVGQLSGGEKARLLIGLATLSGPHLVVLDEPTNHLDIDSRAALVEAINGYAGAVILVSHDRYLLEACAERLWLVGDGTVTAFTGDMDDYRHLVLSGGSQRDAGTGGRAPDNRASRSQARRIAAEKRSELAPLRQRISAAEVEIERLVAEIASLDGALATDLFARDPQQAGMLAKNRSDAAARLARIEEDWLAASTAYEEAMA